jgi:DMATS type aromatic prenyltransferase
MMSINRDPRPRPRDPAPGIWNHVSMSCSSNPHVEADRQRDDVQGWTGSQIGNIEEPSILAQAVPRLRALCEAVGFEPLAIRLAVNALESVMEGWGHRPVHPRWVSDITEDHSAVEFSLSLHQGRPEIRMMIEAQGEQPTVESQYAAAMRLTERLAAIPDVCLQRFREIADIFWSSTPRGHFGLWHSICFTNDRRPKYKAYFNPLLDGTEQAWAKISAAMNRLGLGRALTDLQAQVVREASLDVPKYFALDLEPSDDARVKLYLFHHDATAELLERASAQARNHVPGYATRFMRAMTPKTVLTDRPAATCFGFRGSVPRAAEVNLYVPVCAYAHDDEQIRGRVLSWLSDCGVDPAPYLHALGALARRSLARGAGIHSYVASSYRDGDIRTTIYLSPELRGDEGRNDALFRSTTNVQ